MNDEIFYLAKVRENEYPIPYKLTSSNSSSFTFQYENHDFPQFIKYIYHTNDSLKVLIGSLELKNSYREFKFKRR